MYERIERPLNDSEARRLRRRVTAARNQRPRYWDKWNWFPSIGCFGLITLLALLAESFDRRPLPWLVFEIVGSVLGAAIVVIATWKWRDSLKVHVARLRDLESALRANVAREERVEAPAMIAFEEVEDHGLSFAYQVEPDLVLFLSIGQEYAWARRVRCDAFSIVTIGGYEAYVAKRGGPLVPVRMISAETQRELGLLSVPVGTFPGRLDNIEEILKAYAASHR
jgi:hypothetical protein